MNTFPKIKICGITRVADAECVVEAGVDAIGLVFYEPSPRVVSIEQARKIVLSVGPFVTVVGLFVNAEKEKVNKVLQHVPLHVLQFHGDEQQQFCQQFQRPWVKALRMQEGVEVFQEVENFKEAAGILVDSFVRDLPGGTGVTFDWARLPKEIHKPLILAGGLNADNVCEAIEQVKPYAVDVSGGVESETGIKDKEKVRAFVQAVKSFKQ